MTGKDEQIRAVSIEYGTLDTPDGRIYSVVETVVHLDRDGLPVSVEMLNLVQGLTPTPANDKE